MRRTFTLLMITSTLLCSTLFSANSISKEYKIKAAFIYNFIKYTTWPKKSFTDQSNPITVGIIGKSPFSKSLELMLKDKKIDNREIKISYFKNLKELKTTHILYICKSEKKNIAKIISNVKKNFTLTISDIDKFIDKKGIIGFKTINKKIRFEINFKETQATKIKISVKLIRLAKRVIK